MDQVRNASGELLADYTCDALRRTGLELGETPASWTEYSYNKADWITYLGNWASATSPISRFDYSYDRAGNRRSMDRDSLQDNYGYNKRYELTRVDYSAGGSFAGQTFNYDGVGNRTSVVNGGTTAYVPNDLNEYASVGGTSYYYDLRGNLTNDGEQTYYYDLDNMLTKAVRNSDGQALGEYKYDPFGRRIEKNAGGTVMKYIHDGAREIVEWNASSDQLIQRYIYGEGIDEVLMLKQAGGEQYFYQYDALGDVVNLTDTDGSTVKTYYYQVYGEFSESGGLSGNPFTFTGRRYDPESGLYYYRARMYSPKIGRFLQTDLLNDFNCMNLYLYCRNNSVLYLDPLGLTLITNAQGNADYQRQVDISINKLDKCQFSDIVADYFRKPESGNIYIVVDPNIPNQTYFDSQGRAFQAKGTNMPLGNGAWLVRIGNAQDASALYHELVEIVVQQLKQLPIQSPIVKYVIERMGVHGTATAAEQLIKDCLDRQ